MTDTYFHEHDKVTIWDYLFLPVLLVVALVMIIVAPIHLEK